MVIVTCLLSCAIRRCPPSARSDPYRRDMNKLMQDVGQLADADIISTEKEARTSLKSYDDKMLVTKYEVSFRLTNHDAANEKLISAFSEVLKRRGSSETNNCYYLATESSAIEEDLLLYFYDKPLRTFALGFMSSAVQFNTQFDYLQDLMPRTGKPPTATIEIDLEKILIEFAVSEGLKFHTRVDPGETAPTTEVYRLSIDFKYLSPSLLVNSTASTVDLCFLSQAPLQLWRTRHEVREKNNFDPEKTFWVRTCSTKSRDESSNKRVFSKDVLGGCNAVMLRFDKGPDVQAIIDSLHIWGQFSVYRTFLNYRPKSTPRGLAPFVDVDGKSLDELNWMLAAVHSIGYRVRYQLEDPDIGGKFMDLVEKNARGSKDDRKHLHNALCKTFDVLSTDCDHFLHIDRVLAYFLDGSRELDELVSTRTRMVKRLVITPSRILFQAPVLMHDNRILREFDADSAVSCSFQNDDMSGFGNATSSKDFVEEAIGGVLRHGITVAKRHYQFLGCSGSQLKNNGCWFYAKDSIGNTAADIRAWMGDLEHIRNPGTYLSRMGQCFSDTTSAQIDSEIDIDWSDDDIEGGEDPDGKPYCFSDGVGRISMDCLKLVDDKLPSAFQLRLGGCKGMLTLDKKLEGKRILVRKSMRKFKCSHTKVEVMRRTQPTPLFLNNQVITLLSQLTHKIPDHVFIRLLNTMLHKLADILLDDEKALHALSQSGFKCCYSKLYNNGFKFTTDPFFKGVLKAIICTRLSNLKQKTRIEIPHEYGRAMLGIMDEEDVLEYGEVHVKYSLDIGEPSRVKTHVWEGDIVVSKMPALHPGDIRKFKAVKKPELDHLIDCIVFPRKGPRPHPNEMAGSDLDGDEYFVTWHPDLIFQGDNETAMDFPSIRKKQMERAITVDDMVDFIVDYMVNDRVGTISNAHTAWADAEGIYSDRCKELARIFCHVIDFGKTGYLPDEIQGRKLMDYLPEEYPDFMGKEDHKVTYQSRKVLGKLYRICQRIGQAVTTIDKEDTERINAGSNWTIDERFLIPGHEDFLEEAEKLYNIYAESLDTEQRRYGIETEEELVSGCVLKVKGMYTSSADDVYDTGQRLKERMTDVRKLTQEKFNQFLDKNFESNSNNSRQALMLAAACYVITYRDKRPHRSFPWVFADTLLLVLRRADASGPEPPLVLLTKSLDELDMGEVDLRFEELGIEPPPFEGQARVYFILISWGLKSKFLLADNIVTRYETLRVDDFAELLDQVFEDDENVVRLSDGETGPLLCAVLRALTELNDELSLDDGNRQLSRGAVINMKRQILLGHHQLARDPRVDCLMIQKQGKICIAIAVSKPKWNRTTRASRMESSQKYKDEFQVTVNYRGQKNGGIIHVSGDESNVFDFTDFWLQH